MSSKDSQDLPRLPLPEDTDFREALNQFWDQVRPLLFCHLQSKVRLVHKNDIDDILQNVFVKLLKGATRKYDPEKGSILAWLKKVVENDCKDYRKVKSTARFTQLSAPESLLARPAQKPVLLPTRQAQIRRAFKSIVANVTVRDFSIYELTTLLPKPMKAKAVFELVREYPAQRGDLPLEGPGDILPIRNKVKEIVLEAFQGADVDLSTSDPNSVIPHFQQLLSSYYRQQGGRPHLRGPITPPEESHG